MIPYFERSFQPEDDGVFRELVQSMVGKKITRWRETYAEGIVIDCGDMAPEPPLPGCSPSLRGEWVVSSWFCDVLFLDEQNVSLDGDFEQLISSLPRTVGKTIADITIAPEDVSLIITLEGGGVIIFRTDIDWPEEDQWFIETPFKTSISASSRGRWSFQSN
jgi:hypothetical protein